ncbi:hypothetical protein CIB95_05385 [Lottiidibacillus patelloidae]|uniref:DUF1510 domain-containing protein n=1 Tax=Lottiidibacillus patelloidae TaxID=2670334 RepID=A0A263BW45_9BACI|nr:YrrS family protein [Lottiidibacillus patelloidae]OZM57798.1 hypothetical protein CIB95_05385 [Lottiidibacillus patelloidae]
MRMNRIHERKKRIKKSIMSVTLYVGLIIGACILGISIVHFFFNPSVQPVVSEENNTNTNDQVNDEENKTDSNSGKEQNEDTNSAASDGANNSNGENSNDDNSSNGSGNWEPVGTTQEEPHQTQYDENSVDWEEMKLALSVAINVDKSNMSLWWIGNDGAPDKSFGIVSKRGSNEYKKVTIEWVTEKGWKPTSERNLTQEEYEKYVEPYLTN